MKSLDKFKNALAYALVITGELTFFYGLLAHGSTIGLVCELAGLSLMIVSIIVIASVNVQ